MESRAESVPPMHPKIASDLPHTSGGAAIPTNTNIFTYCVYKDIG
jgi:hypothetical protein